MLEHDPATGIAELPLVHHQVDGVQGFCGGLRNDNALAGSEPVCLDDDRSSQLPRRDDRSRFVPGVADAVARGGDPVPGHELFRERLAALELGCGTGGTKDAKAAGPKQVDNAATERELGTDDGQIDREINGRVGERVDVIDADWDERCLRRDPVVAGRANDLRVLFAREFPRECMLSATTADNEHLHAA